MQHAASVKDPIGPGEPSTAIKTFPNGRLAVSINEFAKMTGFGRSSIYEAIRAGSLRARKFGARTSIIASDGQRWLEMLPVMRSPETN